MNKLRHIGKVALLLAAICFVWCPASAGTADSVGISPRLMGAINDAVRARNGYSADDVEITTYRIRLPDRCREAEHIQVTIPANDRAIGSVTVRATFESGGKTIATVPIPLQVTVFAEALITTRRLKQHEIIAAADVVPQRIDVTRMAAWIVTDPDSAIGRSADRTIDAGQLVDRRRLALVPLIHRGDRVTVTYETGPVRVSTTAVAMEDGCRGDHIQVKAPQAQTLLTVCVIDDKTVRAVPK